jgi:hypothetical protein
LVDGKGRAQALFFLFYFLKHFFFDMLAHVFTFFSWTSLECGIWLETVFVTAFSYFPHFIIVLVAILELERHMLRRAHPLEVGGVIVPWVVVEVDNHVILVRQHVDAIRLCHFFVRIYRPPLTIVVQEVQEKTFARLVPALLHDLALHLHHRFATLMKGFPAFAPNSTPIGDFVIRKIINGFPHLFYSFYSLNTHSV